MSGYTTGQGESFSALSACPVGSPESDKLNHGETIRLWGGMLLNLKTKHKDIALPEGKTFF